MWQAGATEFPEKSSVPYVVECLANVKEDAANLLPLVEILFDFLCNEKNVVCCAAEASKARLVWYERVVRFEVHVDATLHNSLAQLTEAA